MKSHALVVAALAFAACGKQEADPAANNAAEPAAPAAQIEPGLYRQATTLLELTDPTLSKAEADAAAKAIGTTQSEDRCVTPDMVSDPKALIESDIAEGCQMQRSVWDEGKIDIALTCPKADSSTGGKLALTGDYAADSYAIAMNMQGKDGEVMRMKVEAKRIGECPA
ncbi:MAG: DUF3617 family protein [Sphingomicrobium sp.]